MIQWRSVEESFGVGQVDQELNLFADELQIFEKSLHPLDYKIVYPMMPIFNTVVYAMAEHSELITRLFVMRKYNRRYFHVRLLRNLIWEDVYTDCYFPFLPGDQGCFSEVNFNMVWPQILEKAYAKLKSSYDKASQSPIQNVMTDLMGYPLEIIDTKLKSRPR